MFQDNQDKDCVQLCNGDYVTTIGECEFAVPVYVNAAGPLMCGVSMSSVPS